MGIKLGICAIVKNTPDYIFKEWVNHHFNIGVSKIIVIVDIDSTKIFYDNRVEYIYLNKTTRKEYIDIGNKYSPLDNRGVSLQIGVYNVILEKYRNELDWIACIDDDEFLILNINDLEHYSNDTCVILPWKMMFTNDIKCQYNLNNYKEFPPYEKYNIGSGSYVKAIVNTKKIWKIRSVHYGDYCCVVMGFPEITNQYYEGGLINNVFHNKNTQLTLFNKSKNYIKHYKFRSFEEWVERVVDRSYLIYDNFHGESWNQSLSLYFKANPYYAKKQNINNIDKLLDEINRNDIKNTPYYDNAVFPVYNIKNADIIYNHNTCNILNLDKIIDKKHNYIIIDYVKTFDDTYKNCLFINKNIFLEWLRFYNRKNKTKLNEFETIEKVIKIMFPLLNLSITTKTLNK